jgi:ABC-type glycerol-3-phosphate transport system substrate-binding protein
MAATGAGLVAAACTPQVVEKVVTQVVKETVIVAGTPQTVEKVVEKVVTPTRVAGQVPKVRYLTDWYGGDRGMLVSEFLGEWDENYADVCTVAYEPCAAVGDRLVVEFAADTAPDCFLWSFTDTPKFGSWLMDLAPFYDVDTEINEDDIVKNAPIFYENGQKKCLPFQGLYYGEYINLELFEQAGLPMPWEHPDNGTGDKWWNWEDWLEAAVALTALGDDIWGTNLDNEVHGPGWFKWVFGNQGNWVDLENKTTTFTSDPNCLEAMRFQKDLMCQYKVAIPFDEWTAVSESLGVNPARAGMVGIPARMEEGHWKAAEILGQRVGLARSPKNDFMSNHNHQPNAISIKTPYAKEAWELCKFLCNTEHELAIGLNGTSQPCRISSIEDPRYFADQPATAKEALLEAARHGTFYPVHLGWGEWRQSVRPIVEGYLNCEGGEELLAEADRVGTEILQREMA